MGQWRVQGPGLPAQVAGRRAGAYGLTAPSGSALCCTPDTSTQLPNAGSGGRVLHVAVSADERFLLDADRLMTHSENLPLGLASLQHEAASGRALPPVERWDPPFCGDIDIRIARDGTWFHQGTPFARRELVRLFSTILRKDPDGYHLVTPGEKMRIQVDDAPFLAVLVEADGEGERQILRFTTNVGDVTEAGPGHPIRVAFDPESGAPAPYVHVRHGLEARIARAAFYDMADRAVPGPSGAMGVWSGGTFFALDQGP
jgi:hypothetical protein